MIADSYYTIGSTHNECQDYACSGNVEGKPFAIVADGCSSAPYSDWGARLLAQALSMQIYNKCTLGENFRTATSNAQFQASGLGLPGSALRATLGCVTVNGGTIQTTLFGDGYIFARKRDGGWIHRKVEFTSGAPYYPAYEVEKGAREAYLKQFGNSKVIYSGSESEACEMTIDAYLNVNGVLHYNDAFNMKEFDLVAVLSDGLGQFSSTKRDTTQPVNTPISVEAVWAVLATFSAYAPGFVKRRCQRAFETFKEKGWTNRDDFSIAAIHVE
jgi:hypothetical protein